MPKPNPNPNPNPIPSPNPTQVSPPKTMASPGGKATLDAALGAALAADEKDDRQPSLTRTRTRTRTLTLNPSPNPNPNPNPNPDPNPNPNPNPNRPSCCRVGAGSSRCPTARGLSTG